MRCCTRFVSLSLSAASVFAYGQTSSGKTYTMVGITEQSMSDIYDYIDKVIFVFGLMPCCVPLSFSAGSSSVLSLQHPEREFILKFSAMEIYNEAVRDLLSSDATPLRLLDDPEVK
jgi:centromeric protein E